MTEALLLLVADYGALALCVILAINCFGVPFPTSLVMLAVGSLADQGELELLPFLWWGIAGAVIGDQLGYAVGRLGSNAIVRSAKRTGWLSATLKRAKDFETRWGDLGVFLSRWLLSPLGPYVNLVAGMTGYSWVRFSIWDMAGEAVWVSIYIGLGLLFSRSVQNLADLLGSFTWLLVSATVALALGWKLWSSLRSTSQYPATRL